MPDEEGRPSPSSLWQSFLCSVLGLLAWRDAFNLQEHESPRPRKLLSKRLQRLLVVPPVLRVPGVLVPGSPESAHPAVSAGHASILFPLASSMPRPGDQQPLRRVQQPCLPTAIPQALPLHLPRPPAGGVPNHPGLCGVLRGGGTPRDPVPLRLPPGKVLGDPGIVRASSGQSSSATPLLHLSQLHSGSYQAVTSQ